MIKIFRILACMAIAGLAISCHEEEKDPIPFNFEDGGWVKFQELPNFALDVSNINEAEFSSTIIDPIGNAETLQIDLLATVAGTVRDTVPFRTITEFPSEFDVTAGDLADALALEVSQLSGGDSFRFLGTVTTEDGTVYTYENPSYDEEEGFNGGLTHPQLVNAPGFRNALSFTINFVCPFDAAESAGTYRIVRDDFETSVGDDTFEVIAGPGENQVTMVNPFDHINPATGEQDYRVTIDVDPTTGIATIPVQQAWHYSNFAAAPAYGVGSVNTSGNANFVFSCSGTINLFLQHSVGLGSFGNYRFIAEKVE